MEFRVYENQLTTVATSDDVDEAVRLAKGHHMVHGDRYHEVFRIEESGPIGLFQLKPGDKVTASKLLKQLSEPDRIGYEPDDYAEWSIWLFNRLGFDAVVEGQDVWDCSQIHLMDIIERDPCPECGGFLRYWGSSDSIYGNMSGFRCFSETCGHWTVEESSPPAWIIRESREMDVIHGKARMLGSGDIEYPDKYGGF